MKKIIGIIEPICAGKDTMADYISTKLKIPSYQISQTLKEITGDRDIPLSRKDMYELDMTIALEKGANYLVNVLLGSIDKFGVITGMWQLE